jgi:hypothetical protein
MCSIKFEIILVSFNGLFHSIGVCRGRKTCFISFIFSNSCYKFSL